MSAEIEQFAEAIKQLIPISDLSPGAQNDVIEAAEILEFKKKKFVFEQGNKDHYSYYVLAGELELIADDHVHNTMIGGSDNARYAISQLQPRQFSAKAKTPVTVLRLDRGTLDRLMVHEGNKETDIADTGVEMGVSHIEAEDSGDWMTKMLQSELFARLPMANIQQLFAFLEPVAYEKGDTVIKQGDQSDNYYIIQEGTCEVTRVPGEGKKPVKFGEMGVGDSFGEESLLTDATRNATVTMLTDGVMMQLNKDNFLELIKKPSFSAVSFDQAMEIVNGGGVWIDVRFAKEFEVSNIEASTNIPLNLLCVQMDKFNHDSHYVVYCDTGGRSSSAAFLLTQEGFHVSYLEGGLESNPGAGVGQVTPTAAAAEPATKEEVVEEEVDKLEQTIDNVDSAVKASVLEADLAKKKMDLEAAEKKQKKESEQADKKRKEANEAERKKLEQEKIEIERQKKLAEEDLDKTRVQEIVKIEKTKKDAESRMQEEKKQLEEAKRALDDAQHEAKITEAAREGNEEDHLKQKEEEKLNRQMQAELNDWIEEEDERQEQFKDSVSQAEHIKRIRERAEAARQKTEEAADNLFSDISDQISSTDHHKLRDSD